MEIKEKIFKVIIKPDSSVNEIVGFDKNKNAYIIKIKAKPENNKANLELIRFLSKILRKRVKIKSGFKSREKLIEAVK
jgi:uncharacterized protein (TIGR00251 family)